MVHSSCCLCDTLTQTTSWRSFCFAVHLLKIPQEEILKNVESFFTEHQLEWSDCLSVWADGVPCMMGSKKDFIRFVKKKKNKNICNSLSSPQIKFGSKRGSRRLAIVFKEVVSVANYIKSRPLHADLFLVLCDEMGAENSGLLFHSNIRWLSREKVLERVANLRDEIFIF